MAVFEITSPSGEVFEITAPEGASEQDVLSYAQSQFAKQVIFQQHKDLKLDMSKCQSFYKTLI